MKNLKYLIFILFTFFRLTSSAQDIQATINHTTSPTTADGSINIVFQGGLSPYEVYWSGPSITPLHTNQQSISGLLAGNYSAKLTDSQCGEAYMSFTVESGFEPCNTVLNLSKNVINGCTFWDNSSISVLPQNGRAPYSYSWSTGASGTSYLNNLQPGIYTVTATDANGCQAVEYTEIKLLNLSSPNIAYLCSPNGQELATATASATGGTPPYSYSWDFGNWTNQSSQNFTTYATQYHYVGVRDANGCTTYTWFMTNASSGFPLSINISTQYFCDNGNFASLFPSYGGGIPPYSFQWSNGATTQSITNVSSGGYNVTITDSRGCQSTSNWEVVDELIDFNLNIERVSCTTADVKLTLNSSNLHPNWQFKVDNGQWTNFSNFSNIAYFPTLPASRYVYVKNQSGCIISKSIPPFIPRVSSSILEWEFKDSPQCSQRYYCTDYPWVIVGARSSPLDMSLIYNNTATPCELAELYCSIYGIDIVGLDGKLDLKDGATYYNGIERELNDGNNNCLWNVDCVFYHSFLGSVTVKGKGIRNCFALQDDPNNSGTTSYSIKNKIDGPHYKILSLSPNPFNSQINFVTESAQKTDITIEIINPLGVKIDSRDINIFEGTNTNQILLDKNVLVEGIYLFVIKDKMGNVFSRKILHQK